MPLVSVVALLVGFACFGVIGARHGWLLAIVDSTKMYDSLSDQLDKVDKGLAAAGIVFVTLALLSLRYL
jgi:Na+-transporting NADH:ubiquinone oxidoreductase subunit NqrE